MLALIAEKALVDLPDPDVVVVPGGFGTRRSAARGADPHLVA